MRNTNNLYYYESQNLKDNQYRGVISLGNIRKIFPANMDGYTQHSFDIQTPSRVYHFSAGNESELKDWMSVLECLMNNTLDAIGPTKMRNKRLSNADKDSLVKIDPDRFKHKKATSVNFHRLTVTTPTYHNAKDDVAPFDIDETRHKRGTSVIGKITQKFKSKKKSTSNTNDTLIDDE